MKNELSYNELATCASELESSSQKLREQLSKYDSDYTSSVLEFCNTVDSYSRYLLSTVQLIKDSNEALKVIIEKNK